MRLYCRPSGRIRQERMRGAGMRGADIGYRMPATGCRIFGYHDRCFLFVGNDQKDAIDGTPADSWRDMQKGGRNVEEAGGGKLIFGCGYLGERVARKWVASGSCVHAITRSRKRAERLENQGIHPVIADITDPRSLDSIRGLAGIRSVLFAVGWDRTAGLPIHAVYVDGLRAVLERLPDSVRRLVHISSTGVYGQSDGSWVDEESACCPIRVGGKACLDAERVLAQSPMGSRALVLRLAGIYGPDRVPRQSDIVARSALPAEGWLNLIHVDDAVEFVMAAERHPVAPGLYVVSDGCPVLRQDYHAELRRLLKVAPERGDDARPVEMPSRKQRMRGSKRVRSERARRELGVSLQFSDYRHGLASILRDA